MAHSAWALTDDETRLVLELCQDFARDKTLAWFEESVAQIRWGSGGKHRRPVKDGLIVAVFRHYESRAAESKPLLHDHAVVSIRARHPDGTWGNLSADSMLAHIVAADTLYTLLFMEEVTARLGLAWEPREVTPFRRPVMTDMAGIDRRLIGWQWTRRQQIEDALSVLTAQYEGTAGAHAGGVGRLRAGLSGRRPDPPAQAHRVAVADRAADAMARFGDPGVSAPAPSTGSPSGRGRQPRRCGGGRGRWSPSPWRPSTSSLWCM
ncbi:hypothetical protein C6N75_10530 [Streptomyces solincola]|uniref:TrwC relaxase domain-containing protein n=1 Tax=Streptomyces solincola TaxID=2100817 RepID=A0A2S9PXW6_9ACTN|nr:hypothetical protein C6N75_10530 [Streptomyces solincola]